MMLKHLSHSRSCMHEIPASLDYANEKREEKPEEKPELSDKGFPAEPKEMSQ
jgi:hypothetical protein